MGRVRAWPRPATCASLVPCTAPRSRRFDPRRTCAGRAGPASAWPAIAGGRTELGWFLTAEQRGNDATRIRPWTEGNAVRPLVHGSTYFAVLAEALAQAGEGDLVLFSDWRGDPDERLTDDGATVAEALSAAVRRGALVKGLIWRSHLDRLRFSSEENRNLSERVNDVGGEVLLDQRVRAVGSHHQKFVVIRHPERPGGRRRLPRRHRPGARPARRRRPPRRPAGPAVRPPVRAAARRGTTSRSRSAARPSATSRTSSASGGRTPPHCPGCRGRSCPTGCAARTASADRAPAGGAGPARRRHLRGPAPAHLPPAPPRLPVRARRRTQRRPRVRQGAAPGPAPRLRRGPVPVVGRRRAGLRRRAAPRARAAPRSRSSRGTPTRTAGWACRPCGSATRGPCRSCAPPAATASRSSTSRTATATPVYVHAKVCVVDDVWATVGSDNLNRRSWTHDSELTAAILDQRRDGREPRDPAGLGDGARGFARELRLELWREHLDRDDDDGLIDPARRDRGRARERGRPRRLVRRRAVGPRPPGRLRAHSVVPLPLLAAPARGPRLPRHRRPRRAADGG